MDEEIGEYIIVIKDRIQKDFTESNWKELGFLLGQTELIERHPRLLRSYSFGDDDYEGHILDVLKRFWDSDTSSLSKVVAYLDRKYPGESTFISAVPSVRKITFAPNVFKVPVEDVDATKVSVMMPFRKEFEPVLAAIRKACEDANLKCERADDIWVETTFIQDIFNLIFTSAIVVVDFTGHNPNVMYETGIAHTLGKQVVPIAQSIKDVPSDMGHHRALDYLPNREGLGVLRTRLARRLRQITTGSPDERKKSEPVIVHENDEGGGDIPF